MFDFHVVAPAVGVVAVVVVAVVVVVVDTALGAGHPSLQCFQQQIRMLNLQRLSHKSPMHYEVVLPCTMPLISCIRHRVFHNL